MTQLITIDPVTRIEGHSKITIQLDEDGHVTDARFHVTQYRGFERFIKGRPFYELPGIMARICGICTISHELAAAQACEAIMSVRVAGTAADLRRIVNYASLLQSHALSFFYLSSPDFLLGMDAAAESRNIFGLLESHPEVVRDGVALRSFGQRIIERLAGKRIHPDWIVPGGVTHPLKPEHREEILEEIPDMIKLVQRTLDWFKRASEDYQDEARTFANFPTLFLSLVNERDDTLELYRGRLKVVDPESSETLANFHRDDYQDYIGEAVEPDSYLKSPYYIPVGYPDGIYRVGPLARLNMIGKTGTPLADQELAEFRGLNHLSSFYFHQARLVECLHGLEMIQILLDNEAILNKRVRAHASANVSEGIGVTEAPRGTLIHHFYVDEQGLVQGGNLVVATTHNNLAMNRGIQQAARRYIDGKKISDGALNRVEAVIRTFDPCLSCSTHAAGRLALHVQLLDAGGEVIDEVNRA